MIALANDVEEMEVRFQLRAMIQRPFSAMRKPAVGDPACARSRWWKVDVATTSVASQTTLLLLAFQNNFHFLIGSAMAPEFE